MNTHTHNKSQLKKQLIRFLLATLITAALIGLLCVSAKAASVTFDLGDAPDTGDGSFGVVELLFLVTLIALAPSILIMMTSFTRIIIVLSFMRSALGTQQSPPNQVLVGMALFLTLYIMQPVLTTVNEQAYQPYREGLITQQEFLDTAVVPFKEFMLRQTYTDDLNLFLSLSEDGRSAEALIVNGPEDLTQIGLDVIVPSFMTSELKRAFNIGFLLFVPFLIIDLVVSSTLMSMGMVMLPPSMIALPFKIMMFVLVDGWGLLFGNLVKGFR
jgi:flagellar biosynthetic protein FliP